MTTILGIDAAWTKCEPSGVALTKFNGGRWQCLAVAPSYESLIGLAQGHPVDWARPAKGSVADMPSLLSAAAELAGEDVALVTIDMPVATVPITGRRTADQEISRAFGARWCSAHSPGPIRPGPLGEDLSCRFAELGYPIATRATAAGMSPCLVEVYPHPALLTLLERERRVPYKISKAGKYWKGTSPQERIRLLLTEFSAIEEALARRITRISLNIPSADDVTSLASLKRYEDALDALVCCWIGSEFMASNAYPLGDDTAAIWLPN